jgi:hypothetical protein
MGIGRIVLPVAILIALPANGARLERPGAGGVTTIAELPGWWHAGNNRTGFDVSLDRQVRHDGRASARLASRVKSPTGFGSLMQVSDALDFRGKRVRLSAWLKADGVAGHAGLWMRVDGPAQDPTKPLAVDVMADRPVVGTRDWQRYEIVLDVPHDATDIAFGAHTSGEGAIWVDDFRFEDVGHSGPTSGSLAGPQNLDFERR